MTMDMNTVMGMVTTIITTSVSMPTSDRFA